MNGGGGGWSRTCDCLAAAEYPHVTVVPDEDELAADAHVEAGDHHDRTRYHAPQQQKEQRPVNNTSMYALFFYD